MAEESGPGPLSGEALEEAHRLALALNHELANVMAGVHLQAFLLTDDPSPRELANASLDLDDLCAQACSLLSLMRPLLSAPAPAPGKAAAVLGGLQAGLDDHVGKGVDLLFSDTCDERDASVPLAIAVDDELVRCLLMPIVLYGAEIASPGGKLVVDAARGEAREVVFGVEDDGSGEESLEGWREQASRGRPLACQVADCILARQGGRLGVVVAGGRTRVELRVPLQ